MATKFRVALKELIMHATVTIPDEAKSMITKVGLYSFYKCESLVTVDLPNVTTIDGASFLQCTSLATVNLPNLTAVGDCYYGGAFKDCSSLTDVNMPKLTRLVGGYRAGMFMYCTSLATIELPSVSASSGENVFYGCSNLKEIHYSAANETAIKKYTYYYTWFNGSNAQMYFDL